jgi:hypothetical protein
VQYYTNVIQYIIQYIQSSYILYNTVYLVKGYTGVFIELEKSIYPLCKKNYNKKIIGYMFELVNSINKKKYHEWYLDKWLYKAIEWLKFALLDGMGNKYNISVSFVDIGL